ncbi:proline-rich transmembrane protein 4 isoform X2 [Paramormyrops kingsleyae]|uniref:Proline rich transmembrane protein 4 n=1 Tax=Paramormyrops kingsleyae TaxID=1676925 RepID=A0A3B3QP48_9TELE|nr:proline-rich transmembrane protein 4 isoform X2 [Paramormyrops kingsleyae]
MLLHVWTLALCLGTFPSVSPTGAQVTRSSSSPQADSRSHGGSSDMQRDSSFWSIWAPPEDVIETKTSSFFSLPVTFPFGLWSSQTRSEDADKSTENPKAQTSTSAPSDAVLKQSGGSSFASATDTSWNASITTPDPITAGPTEDTKPSASIFSYNTLQSSTQDDGAELSWPKKSLSNENFPSQTPTRVQTQPVKNSTSHVSLSEKIGTTEPLDTIATPSGLDTAIATDQDAKRAPGTESKISIRLLGDGANVAEDRTESGPSSGSQKSENATRSTPTQRARPSTPANGTPTSEVWLLDTTPNESYSLPDCNSDISGACNASDAWNPAFPDDNATSNQSYNPLLLLTPPMFVPLYSDWNTAMATWGVAWEAHIYGLGSLFAVVAALAVINLSCLPFRCPSGCGYFALVSLFLLIAGSSRAFSLFYDAYSHQDKLPAAGTLLLYEAPFPCLTAAFGIVFLLLSMRSRMQLSHSVLQHPCFLAVLVLLHFATTFGSVALLQVFTQLPCLFFISQGAFVVLAASLATTYLVFYCYVRADSKHIYHLNNTSPPVERYNRCPFADAKDWDRAAATAVFSSLFVLACAGLQLYAMLHALGLGGAEVFLPWPWWAFHLSCRVCEASVCLTLSFVVMHPLCCSSDLPQPSCWPKVFRGHLAMKSSVLPNNYPWSQQEKLVICDTIARGESECLPLYALVDHRLDSVDGLDLLYHSHRVLAVRDTDHIKAKADSLKSSSASLHLDSDSTADLRPPSPINLRRSIDEALFSEALFPQSIFSSFTNLSFSTKPASDSHSFWESSADRSLYRTSSCTDVEAPQALPAPLKGPTLSGRRTQDAASFSSSADHWHGSNSSSVFQASLDGSSLVLCSSPERLGQGAAPLGSGRVGPGHLSQSNLNLQRRYQVLGSASQESLHRDNSQDLAVQAEFISACRQIDTLSVCSDTIDL